MRDVKYIVLHCTATSPTATVKAIKNYWKTVRGWKNPGYHVLIDQFGKANKLINYNGIANGVSGYNSECVHISYIGGIDEAGKPKDTRTRAQETQMISTILELRTLYPKATILGHRDFPGVNKACPSFEVSEWLKKIGIQNTIPFHKK